MPETSDAAALTAVVVAEEEARRDAQAAAEAGELLPDDLYDDWTTAGNNLAIQLVTDGLKIQPCSPGFVDGRNAIVTPGRILGDNSVLTDFTQA